MDIYNDYTPRNRLRDGWQEDLFSRFGNAGFPRENDVVKVAPRTLEAFLLEYDKRVKVLLDERKRIRNL